MPPNEFPLWRDDTRIDGVNVARDLDGWVVLDPHRRLMIQSCPCCIGLMRTQRRAMQIADKFFPARAGTA